MPVNTIIRAHRTRTDFVAQEDCLLFKNMPQEVRDMIWTLVFTAYNLESHPYDEQVYLDYVELDEPSYDSHAQRINTALLSTCCRIYQEARRFPVSINEHVFKNSDLAQFTYTDPNTNLQLKQAAKYSNDPRRYFQRMDTDQRSDAKRVRIMLNYEDFRYQKVPTPLTAVTTAVFAMQSITHLTIRMSAWYWYTDDDSGFSTPDPRGSCGIDFRYTRQIPLTMMKGFVTREKAGIPTYVQPDSLAHHLPQLISLQRLNFELEAFDNKRDTLDAVCECAKTWEFKLENGCVLKVCEPLKPFTRRQLSGNGEEPASVLRRVVTWVVTDGVVPVTQALADGKESQF